MGFRSSLMQMFCRQKVGRSVSDLSETLESYAPETKRITPEVVKKEWKSTSMPIEDNCMAQSSEMVYNASVEQIRDDEYPNMNQGKAISKLPARICCRHMHMLTALSRGILGPWWCHHLCEVTYYRFLARHGYEPLGKPAFGESTRQVIWGHGGQHPKQGSPLLGS